VKRASLAVIALVGLASGQARAEGAEPPKADPKAEASADVKLDGAQPAADASAGPPSEAPPVAPHKKGFVIDSSLGVLGFAGQFRKVAPPGPWLHTQLGFEIFKWLMVFGEGELAFTDTSNAQDQPKTRAFPIFGFGAGVRFTVHVTERVGLFLQGHGGFLKADVTKNALGLVGYRDAESLGLYYGGRLGVEWYQLDRHLAIGITGGSRLAQGFKTTTPGKSDTPIFWEGGGSLRYTF
jgi:hypothetical protein